MLREPAEFLISSYKMILRQPEEFERFSIPQNKSLSETIIEQPGMENLQTRWLAADMDILSLTKDLGKQALESFFPESTDDFALASLSEQKILETAKKHLSECAFFGLVEKYEESLFLLCYTFGWKPFRDIFKLNFAFNKSQRSEITKEAMKSVDERTKLDTELYQYAKNLFESSYVQMVEQLSKKYGDSNFTKNPSNDEVFQLLEKNYDGIGKSEPLKNSIKYNFGQAICGTGWLNNYSDKSGIFSKWTGPGTTSVIDFPLSKDTDLKIQFHVINSMALDILKSLKLSVNENQVLLKRTPDEQSKKAATFEGIIPKEYLQNKKNITSFVFQVNRTVAPSSINSKSKDTRKIGLAFDRLYLFPVEEHSG